MQSRKHSAFEAVANVAVGYGLSMLTQIAVFPFFGIHIPLRDNAAIGAVFTVVSLGRAYALRRAFNRFHRRSSVIR